MIRPPKRAPGDGAVMIVDVFIHTTYPDGETGYTIENELELWPPRTTVNGPDLDGWALEQLEPLTEPRTPGATFIVLITRSTISDLVGRVWKYGG
jgi:hypothetical protein